MLHWYKVLILEEWKSQEEYPVGPCGSTISTKLFSMGNDYVSNPIDDM